MKRMLDRVLENTIVDRESLYPLSFDCDVIKLELIPGEKYQGSFRVTSDDKAKPEGIVYSGDIRMTIKTPEFGGLGREIAYSYDTTGLKEGSVNKGVIHIVSNIGECELPYEIRISSMTLDSNVGQIKNLFHFANLARTNWNEAVELFYSSSFENLLTGNDSIYLSYYRGLSFISDEEYASEDFAYNESNVDCFLELTKKKNKIVYSVSEKKIELKKLPDNDEFSVTVNRKGWGYTKVSVTCTDKFIFCDKDILYTEDFEEDKAILNFRIDKNELHLGKNSADIVISDSWQEVVVPVCINIGCKTTHQNIERRGDTMRIMRLYIEYRLGKITKNEWGKECSVTLAKMISKDENNIINRLYQVHFYIIQRREEDARNIFEIAKGSLNDDTQPEIIGYSLYLEYLLTRDDAVKRDLAENLELLYVQNKRCWRLAWLLLYMKESFIRDSRERWRFLKTMFEDGCNSPLLFIEALGILVETPAYMSSLSDFELEFMEFARRRNVLTADIRSRFAFVVSKEVAYSLEIYNILTECYHIEPQNEILTQICILLMKGNRTDDESFKWYEKAVEEELRINRLYEYYIMSIDLNYTGRLPKIVLMYFAYRSNLDFERNAFLYANILRHKPAYQDIYNDYLPVIKEFAIEQLHKRRINENLAFIYKTVIGDDLYTDMFAEEYAYALTVNRITVKRDDIVSVVIVNNKLKYQERYTVYAGMTLVSIISSDSCILLEDNCGNKYVDTSLYTMHPIVKKETQPARVMAAAPLSILSALYAASGDGDLINVSDENENALLYLTENQDVSEEYKNNVMLALATYYFDRNDIAKLDDLLIRFDATTLKPEMRESVIKIMVARGMYDRALDWVKEFGPEYIDDKILVRLLDRIIARYDYEYDRDVLCICEKLFAEDKYDEEILNYLLLYKQGSSKSLKVLWRAADSFGLDSSVIIENMVVQMLYSGASVGEETNIFLEYASDNRSQQIEVLFLERLAYLFFAKNVALDDSVFDRCIYLHQMDEKLSDYVKLAFLKRCQSLIEKNKKLDSEKTALIVLFVKEFCIRHMVFPFFMVFKNILPKLSLYDDRKYIEYHGAEGSRVVLHYVIESDNHEDTEYHKEEMNHLIGGIYIKSFVLFYGEKIRYYITEENSRSEKLTESNWLECLETSKEEEHRYSCLNNIAISREMKDDKTFCKLSEEYIKKCYLVEHLFLPAGSEE